MSRHSRISRRKQFGIEGLEVRTMMAVDLPRIVPPAIANHIAQLIAPPRRGGNTGGGNTDGGPIVDSGERAILRGLATAAAEITAIDAALHPLLARAGDPLPEGAAAQLERIGAAANHIDSTVSPLLENTDPPTDPAGPNAAGVPAANGGNFIGPNHPGPLPPTGTHLVRALTFLADRMERLDTRITDLLDDADAASLSDRVKLLLGQINRRAEHIAADIADDDTDPPVPVPTPVERHLMGVVAHLRVGKAALDHAVERLGEPGGEVPPLIARFLNSINNHATSVVGQIDEALPDDEVDPAAAAAPGDNAGNLPRHRHPLPGIVVANASITGADHQVRRILASLGEDGLTDRVQELLTAISDCAQAMADKVSPYLPSDGE